MSSGRWEQTNGYEFTSFQETLTMSQNPFASPQYTGPPLKGIDSATGKEHSLQLVSQWLRFATYLIDRVLMTLATVIAGFGLGIVLAVLDPQIEEGALDALGFGVGLVVVFGYYAFFELVFRRTPGKFLTGTIVVDENGGPPSVGQIFGRTACRFIPFEAFSFLFGDPKRVVGWHDTISKTRVVKR